MKHSNNKIVSLIKISCNFFLLILILYSCTEDIILNELPTGTKRVVIEGWITNLDSVLRIKVSFSTFKLGSYLNYDSLIIKDAIVIISDNSGSSDTLKFSTAQYDFLNRYYCYLTSKIKGIPGFKYHLYVKVGEEEFNADTEMLFPQKIDTVYYTKYRNETKHEDRYTPVIRFHDDTMATNYYFATTGFNLSGGSEFNMSLFSDELSQKGEITVTINKTVAREWWRREMVSVNLYPNQSADYYLYTINEDTYRNLEALINQIESDGGLYSPAPGNLPTNIKGGAIGYFGAIAGSVISYVPPGYVEP